MKLIILITLLYSSMSFAGGFYSCYTRLTEESQQGAPEFIVTVEGDSANVSVYPPQDGTDYDPEFLTTLTKVATPTKTVIYSGQYVYENGSATVEFVQFPIGEHTSAGILYTHSTESVEGEKWAEALECKYESEDLIEEAF